MPSRVQYLSEAGFFAVLQVLFHSPFLERCKQIIAAALAEACSIIQEPLAAALAAAAQHDPEPAGHLQPGVWPSVLGTAAESAAAAAAAGVLERAGSLWTAGSLGQANGTWGQSSRAQSMHPSGAMNAEQGTTGECHAFPTKTNFNGCSAGGRGCVLHLSQTSKSAVATATHCRCQGLMSAAWPAVCASNSQLVT
jgi:hypothetical protein